MHSFCDTLTNGKENSTFFIFAYCKLIIPFKHAGVPYLCLHSFCETLTNVKENSTFLKFLLLVSLLFLLNTRSLTFICFLSVKRSQMCAGLIRSRDMAPEEPEYRSVREDDKKCSVKDARTATKSHLSVPRKGIPQPQSQFPYLCVCERFIYSQDRSRYFLVAE
jgi:hypothetical protein